MYQVKTKKKVILFFRVIALCKFGHKDISKTITASSLTFGQLIEDDERITK